MIEFTATFPLSTQNAQVLAPIIRHMMEEAERWLGPAFNPPRIERVAIWNYPFSSRVCLSPDRTRATIMLADLARTDARCLACHLAHECIHLLSPVPLATNLEEGLAVEFSMRYVAERFGTDGWLYANEICPGSRHGGGDYLRAWSATRRLLAANDCIIQALREHQPVISTISADLILEFATCGANDATFLAGRF